MTVALLRIPATTTASTAVAFLFLTVFGSLHHVHARPCQDARKRFVQPGSSSKKINCSSSSAKSFCTGGSSIDNIVDFMCPKKCGKCSVTSSGSAFPCVDAPDPIRFGKTKKGTAKTCAWLRRTKKRACSSGSSLKKLSDYVCPETCGKCDGDSSTTKTTAKPKPAATTPKTQDGDGGGTAVKAGDDKKHPRSQIMLYWDAKFKWQGTEKQRSWCMECRRNCPKGGGKTLRNPSSGCKKGDSVTIAECDENNRNQWWVWDHGLIRSYTKQDQCVDWEDDRYFELKTCSRDDRYQTFKTDKGFNTKGTEERHRFEVYAKYSNRKKNMQCMTQEHHPKCGEMLLHQPCFRPRNHKTSYWVADTGLCGHKNDGRC